MPDIRSKGEETIWSCVKKESKRLGSKDLNQSLIKKNNENVLKLGRRYNKKGHGKVKQTEPE